MGTEKFYILTIYLLQEIIGFTANNYSTNLCTNISAEIFERYSFHINKYCPCKNTDLSKECCPVGFYPGAITDKGISEYNYLTNYSNFINIPPYDDVTKNGDPNKVSETGILVCINKNVQYLKMNFTKSKQNFYIHKNRTVYLPHYEKLNNSDVYCVGKNRNLLIYVCHSQKNEERLGKVFHISAKIISLLCLVATFSLFAAALPDITLYEKSLMCHCCCLICAYVCLVPLEFLNVYSCTILGHVNIMIIYFLFSSFLWINVMCILRWLAFRVLQGYDLPNRVQRRERKLFISLSIYAWGAPCVHILLTSLEKYYGNCVKTNYPLGGNTQQCLLEDEPSNPFICFPLTLIPIMLNIVLLILTAFNIKRFSRGLSILKKFQTAQMHNHKRRRATFYYKLLFAMFFNPLMHFQIIQLFAWTTGKTLVIYDDDVFLPYVVDFLHVVYGLFIFFYYIWFNNDLWPILREKYIKKPSNVITTNQATRTTTSTC